MTPHLCHMPGGKVNTINRLIAAIVILLGLLSLAASVSAQAPINNPTTIGFTCPDHAQDDGHRVEIVSPAGVVVQTLDIGDPAANASGEVIVDLNVQPIAFGAGYTFRVRALAGTVSSDPSAPSTAWNRIPGRPGITVVR
jgi:hypothetical protein